MLRYILQRRHTKFFDHISAVCCIAKMLLYFLFGKKIRSVSYFFFCTFRKSQIFPLFPDFVKFNLRFHIHFFQSLSLFLPNGIFQPYFCGKKIPSLIQKTIQTRFRAQKSTAIQPCFCFLKRKRNFLSDKQL